MANMEEAIENIEFLAGSKTRVRILDLLSQHKELDKQELRDQIDASRTTVQRNLDTLVDQGWIQNTNRSYEIDTCGDLVAEKFLELTETIEIESRLQPFLKWVDRPEFDLDLHLLADAELLLPETNNPYAMINRHAQLLEQTDDHRLVLPLVGLHPYEAGHRKIVNDGGQADSVVTPGVADTLQSNPDYAPLTEEMKATGRYNLSISEKEIPYFIGIFDRTVQIGVDEDGEPRAMLETDSEQVVEWAKGKHESYKEQSETVF